MRRPSSPKSSPATVTDVPTYEWADLRLSTTFDVVELPLASPAGCGDEWRVFRRDTDAPFDARRRWFHRWRDPDGRRWLSFARVPGGYLLRFHGLADFEIRSAERSIEGYVRPGTPSHTFAHLLLDQVLPLAAGAAGRLTLHASVVNVEGAAAVFMGATGQGKSTMAAALARRGHAVLSDDCCVLRRTAAGFAVVPAYPGLRLYPETIDRVFGSATAPASDVAHYSTKQRILPPGARAHPPGSRIPLRCLYTLAARGSAGPAADIAIEPRSRRDGVLDVVGATFYLDVRDAGHAREGFELAVAAASSCPVRLLTLPWSLDRLDDAAASIVADLRR